MFSAVTFAAPPSAEARPAVAPAEMFTTPFTAVVLPSTRLPAVTFVAPVYVFAPLRTVVPVPF